MAGLRKYTPQVNWLGLAELSAGEDCSFRLSLLSIALGYCMSALGRKQTCILQNKRPFRYATAEVGVRKFQSSVCADCERPNLQCHAAREG